MALSQDAAITRRCLIDRQRAEIADRAVVMSSSMYQKSALWRTCQDLRSGLNTDTFA